MKHEIYLNEGWNLVSFQFEIDLNYLKSNKNILEIKSTSKSYNSSVPDIFNNLKELKINEGYFVKCKSDELLVIEGKYVNNIIY